MFRRLSLRSKLMLLLLALPISTLALYLLMVMDLFKSDKRTYVLDTSLVTTRALAAAVQGQMQMITHVGQFAIQEFENKKLHRQTVPFLKNIKPFDSLALWQNQGSKGWAQVFSYSTSVQKLKLSAFQEQVLSQSRLLFQSEGEIVRTWLMPEIVGTKSQYIVEMTFIREEIFSDIRRSSDFTIILATDDGEALELSSSSKSPDPLEFRSVLRVLLQGHASFGAQEIETGDQKKYLFSFAKIGYGNLSVVSALDVETAYAGVRYLVSKSILFFVALMSGSFIISILATYGLTQSLKKLQEGAKNVSEGKFTLKVSIQSQDEIGNLAQSFNLMASRILELMLEAEERVRLQSELKIARTVQENLFPKNQAVYENLNLVASYFPANEVGGDWWYYHKVKDKIYLWIGDATGHGVASALLTSAARATAAFVESTPDMEPSQILCLLNKALYSVSNGNLHMTFFLACYDSRTGVVTYSNASHEPPILLSEMQTPLNKKSLIFLNDNCSAPLGRSMECSYAQSTIHLNRGDRIFLYTDGLKEIVSPNGQILGERRFLDNLVQSFNSANDLQSMREFINASIDSYSQNTKKIDDIAYVIVERTS